MPKVRLDTLLADRGLFESRSRAAASVMAGQVLLGADRRRAEKPGQMVADDVALDVDRPAQYVSRGGIKLANALDALGLDAAGRQALDVGASTGGFTDVLLQRGAAHVTALDVAYGELHWRLRTDDRVTVIERVNARALRPEALPYAPDLIVADVSFISLTKVLPAVLECAAGRFDCLAMVKPQFEVGRERVGKGGVVRDEAARREAIDGVADAARDLGAEVLGEASSGLPGPKGNLETFLWLGERGEAPLISRAAVLTHARPDETVAALDVLRAAAASADVTLVFDREEAEKHGIVANDAVVVDGDGADVDICIVLGGDGTILKALRRYAGTQVVVFAVNFGEVGFLATIDRDECADGFARAFRGECEALSLPAIALDGIGVDAYAINDVSIHRKVGERVAKLSYGVGGETVASVRCDGIVVASPAGSTGYNLANGGPVMAWGVEGFVVSFIAPHSLTARPLVVAPNDELTIHNQSPAPMEVTVDGRPVGELGPHAAIVVRFVSDAALLAQNPGSSFYRRLREKFGRLST